MKVEELENFIAQMVVLGYRRGLEEVQAELHTKRQKSLIDEKGVQTVYDRVVNIISNEDLQRVIKIMLRREQYLIQMNGESNRKISELRQQLIEKRFDSIK